ncbi:MAG: chromosome partitioning protein ParB [Deltaproteobacteria bacterium]|nr:MAG: chromosome partitioning protein ParB [Deltaproteobacteria bacterium]
MPSARKRPVTKSGKPRARKGVKLKPTELQPAQLRLETTPPELQELTAAIEKEGGAVLATYREPLGGHALLFAALPVDKVEPTPFQRDVSDAHVLKLTRAMDKTRRYLDPIIAVREQDGFRTPNGGHRLTALKELGAKAILALVVPEREVAYQILALNIEKAHNLREKALEVVRMYRDLAGLDPSRKESEFALEFEEAALVTLGFAYEKRGRLSGGAYAPALKKVDQYLDQPLEKGVGERERRAQMLLDLDDAVSAAVEKLKERGLTSPYLKAFVVARVNPLRFIKGEPPPFDELLATMTKRARGMDPERIRTEDLARSGGPADE